MLALLACSSSPALVIVLLVWRPWEAPEPAPRRGSPSERAGQPSADAGAERVAHAHARRGPFTPVGGSDETAEPTEPCAPEQIAIVPAVDKPAYAADERVQLSFTIENTGEGRARSTRARACRSTRSAPATRSCIAGRTAPPTCRTTIVQLAPGEPQSTVPVEWDRTASSIETCTAERPQVPAGGAAYELTVRVGDYVSQQSAEFILE